MAIPEQEPIAGSFVAVLVRKDGEEYQINLHKPENVTADTLVDAFKVCNMFLRKKLEAKNAS